MFPDQYVYTNQQQTKTIHFKDINCLAITARMCTNCSIKVKSDTEEKTLASTGNSWDEYIFSLKHTSQNLSIQTIGQGNDIFWALGNIRGCDTKEVRVIETNGKEGKCLETDWAEEKYFDPINLDPQQYIPMENNKNAMHKKLILKNNMNDSESETDFAINRNFNQHNDVKPSMPNKETLNTEVFTESQTISSETVEPMIIGTRDVIREVNSIFHTIEPQDKNLNDYPYDNIIFTKSQREIKKERNMGVLDKLNFVIVVVAFGIGIALTLIICGIVFLCKGKLNLTNITLNLSIPQKKAKNCLLFVPERTEFFTLHHKRAWFDL